MKLKPSLVQKVLWLATESTLTPRITALSALILWQVFLELVRFHRAAARSCPWDRSRAPPTCRGSWSRLTGVPSCDGSVKHRRLLTDRGHGIIRGPHTPRANIPAMAAITSDGQNCIT